MAIIPDDIQNTSNNVKEQIQTLYDYIVYMKEQLEFWGKNRVQSINEKATVLTTEFPEVYTDESGKYELSGLSDSDTVLSASCSGYIVYPYLDEDTWNVRICTTDGEAATSVEVGTVTINYL